MLFKYICLHFPRRLPPPSHPYPLPLILPPFGFVHVSFIDVPVNPSPFPFHYVIICTVFENSCYVLGIFPSPY